MIRKSELIKSTNNLKNVTPDRQYGRLMVRDQEVSLYQCCGLWSRSRISDSGNTLDDLDESMGCNSSTQSNNVEDQDDTNLLSTPAANTTECLAEQVSVCWAAGCGGHPCG